MPTIQELQPLLSEPREDLGAEYKDWLNLDLNEHKAVLAKAAIAMANYGGGFIVLGMAEVGGALQSGPRPGDVPEITQDAVNAVVRRYAAPEFHCAVYSVPHPGTGVVHPVVGVPGDLTEPVMSKRDCPGVLAQNRCYVRKPGPRSEEPTTPEEWRSLLQRCLRAGREDMLDAIRAIVSGRVEPGPGEPNIQDRLEVFCEAGRERWRVLTADLPDNSPPRFPHGWYEMAFAMVGAEPASSLGVLRDRLEAARHPKVTGWTPFLEMTNPAWAPQPVDDLIEAWVGRPARDDWMSRDPSLCDFWRAARDGTLFTMRGYSEDGSERARPGEVIDVTLPVWRVGEGLLLAGRFADQFGAQAIGVRCRFTGLEARRLVSLGGRRAVFGDDVSHTDEITLTAQTTAEQIRDNLAEVVHGLLTPLYERFNFFRLPPALVGEELSSMRDRRL